MTHRSDDDLGPPALVRILLLILLPKAEREFYLGDLQERGRRPWLREIVGVVALRFTARPRRSQGGRSANPLS